MRVVQVRLSSEDADLDPRPTFKTSHNAFHTMICTLMRRISLLILIGVLTIAPMAQQTTDQRAAWNRPFQPFHLIGNIYYVGAAGVSAFLIVTPAGSFLLDGTAYSPEFASRLQVAETTTIAPPDRNL